MIVLNNTCLRMTVSNAYPDLRLRSLLTIRIAELDAVVDEIPSYSVTIIIFEAGDHLAMMEAKLGFTPMQNLVDQCLYGDPKFSPSWEWIEVHEGWFELAYVFSDDDPGTLIFVQRAEGVDSDLISLCNEWSGIPKAD